MKLAEKIGIDEKSLKHLYTIGGAVSIIVVLYYATGIYKNYLEIKELRDSKKSINNLKNEDL